MNCQRCGGLIVKEVFEDGVNGDWCEMGRCLNCGELMDPVVNAHRAQGAPCRIGKYTRVEGRKDHFFAQAVRAASLEV